jgi:predicted flap endonuclease-1-like 5' DNA nuclease
MRHIFNSMVCISIAAVLTGCGSLASNPTAARLAGNTASAQGILTDALPGSIVFDKEITYKTIDILGVGGSYEAQLKTAGITKVQQLLLEGATRADRKNLAKETGISEKLILTWVNHSDLMRVTGCGPEYSRLLERAGVDSVVELAGRNSIHLAAALKAANDLGGGKTCVKRLPDVVTTTKWVNNAINFKRIVTY